MRFLTQTIFGIRDLLFKQFDRITTSYCAFSYPKSVWDTRSAGEAIRWDVLLEDTAVVVQMEGEKIRKKIMKVDCIRNEGRQIRVQWQIIGRNSPPKLTSLLIEPSE